MSKESQSYTSVEICAGAGGQAVGLHNAGFTHRALIEIDEQACATLKSNVARLAWDECRVLREDLKEFDPRDLGLAPGELTLLAGGVPCPPFSSAGRQLGRDDERDLFPVMLKLVRYLEPRAVMIENVRGLLEPAEKFRAYREYILDELRNMGYEHAEWKVLEARDFGVPQLRPRAILVALKKEDAIGFRMPEPRGSYLTVANALKKSMRDRFDASIDPNRFDEWLKKAEERGTVAPTLVGGSKKHGGADLGPTRAKRAWAELGIDGTGVADDPDQMVNEKRDLLDDRGPKLTVQQAAIIQGFPPDWVFEGRKTARYRQVGNAFPPPVAQAVGERIIAALQAADDENSRKRSVSGQENINDETSGQQVLDLPIESKRLVSSSAVS